MDIYFIGINDNILQTQNNFYGSITVERNFNTKNNICFKDIYPNKFVDYNNIADLKKIDRFFIKCVKKIIKKNPNAYFMRYNEHNLKHFNLRKYHILSANKYQTYNFINNKFKIRERLKTITNILHYDYVCGRKKIKNYLLNRWSMEDCDFVLQEKFGFAGHNTFIFTKNNYNQQLKKLKQFTTYSISILQKNSIPINIHLFIQNDRVEHFAPSQQIINTDKNQMNYDGALFNLEASTEKLVIKEAQNIGEFLRALGYQGVLGIDFILSNNVLYFMEINARFQTSSAKLNEMLLQIGEKTLFNKQLNLLTTLNKKNLLIKN